ncbi:MULTISPECIES: prepilin-type N-terminal cleavage/methylation domain-containing protein [Legionella]|uniref:Prepilin-type N-terminal cleavage/methylation domain-containing protein n=1 Tax=Legionella resiliens TaxID=2905958 RepID=A0ABS8X8J7_9GAMM|nr:MULTISPECIES: prepilin-type N-terminal cleavage/methylation domain-containing protein [unclassified Legionella]MCE0724201.1 prepilin-type N-terminal cleavage/methylation domain-containing protein [Legionella sp. 9fVS26]MCE3533353.1 prepilin-type N-terminal cleavage/methylation domain-containing protein [Legionella sp. 8cVS16]QLZ69539.1 prepilin-type cleavage/methylation domain-containing protein [Legionella sp. PC1000]
MNGQKGFSLIEVLVSLSLITTLTLALLQQQGQSNQLLNQLIFRVQGSQFLDQIEETLVAKASKLPPTPSPYHLDIQLKNQQLLLHLVWFEQVGSITRQHNLIGSGE